MNEAVKLTNYSYEDYLDIDKTTKENVELIFGDIYMMAGASAVHQDIVGTLFFQLKTFSKSKKICFPRIAPYDLKLTAFKATHVVQPDVMIFCQSKELPCAIFEVLSPSTAYKDKTVKKDLYEACGVREYFLVNPDYQVIDRFILENAKYLYDKAYGIEDMMRVECMDEEMAVSEIFEEALQ